MKLPVSKLIKNQDKIIYRYERDGVNIGKVQKAYKCSICIRWDDCCGNGHNTFSILPLDSAKVIAFCPQLQELIPFHLVSSDGPLHYLSNTRYWVELGKYDYARSSAIWPDVSDDYLRYLLKSRKLKKALESRLPSLMWTFKEKLNRLVPEFTY